MIYYSLCYQGVTLHLQCGTFHNPWFYLLQVSPTWLCRHMGTTQSTGLFLSLKGLWGHIECSKYNWPWTFNKSMLSWFCQFQNIEGRTPHPCMAESYCVIPALWYSCKICGMPLFVLTKKGPITVWQQMSPDYILWFFTDPRGSHADCRCDFQTISK